MSCISCVPILKTVMRVQNTSNLISLNSQLSKNLSASLSQNFTVHPLMAVPSLVQSLRTVISSLNISPITPLPTSLRNSFHFTSQTNFYSISSIGRNDNFTVFPIFIGNILCIILLVKYKYCALTSPLTTSQPHLFVASHIISGG